ncbi:steroid 17-alpha-hydroxylase/17,20 lyase-like [Xenia sp. Carnegie-2017]|uniref:steroid 17-alpha-hydroxylase/17,20 lyase-like n=1 Tax=Xenia sp. Carnegie-2017 TaxID=2897299 RepID=UPI001F04AB96|nr:steroid 17-alpha-hydroxylase/17,20 lyase-like [Xenia sp. Carnegie-2017]
MSRDLPPGPFPLPFLGNLNLIGTTVHIDLAKLAKKYGDLMTIYFGSERALVVSSSEMAREVLVRQSFVFGGRPLNLPYAATLFSHDGKNIAFSKENSQRWKKQRKIFYAAYRSFGNSLENKACDVIKDLMADLGEKTVTPRNIPQDIFHCVANIICAITFGFKYDKDDPEFHALMNNFDVSVIKLKSATNLLDTIVLRIYGEHETANPVEDYDLTHAFQKQSDDIMDSKSNDVILTKKEITCMMKDIFIAGIETSTSVITWGLYLLAFHSDIQDQIYEEMMQVLGPDSPPTFSDRHRLPLLWASITETLRYGSIVPLLLPHRATSDAKINGFHIPKDTTVIVNAFAIHNDARTWHDPHVFRPARFLNSCGNYSTPPPFSTLPFSAGSRVCVGETLAKMVVFDVIARMLYSYRMTLVNMKYQRVEADMTNTASILKPKHLQIALEKRCVVKTDAVDETIKCHF